MKNSKKSHLNALRESLDNKASLYANSNLRLIKNANKARTVDNKVRAI